MYKTIVAYVDDSSGCAQVQAIAVQLANEHGAHLVVTAVTGWTRLDYNPANWPSPGMAPPPAYERARAAARQRLEQFAAACQAQGVAQVETRLLPYSAEQALALQSRYCDLLLVGQQARTDGSPLPASLASNLAAHAARPVLMAPAREGRALDGTVVLGWNASREASHAIAGALPLLRRADNVVIAVFNPDQGHRVHGDEPGADLAAYLARHCARVDVVSMQTSLTPGAALLTLAENAGAGLIVAGAFGHSRFNEWMLGGTSAALVEQAAIPVLMMH